jgi:membrane protease subunit (stomatin/prohibitin family)
LWFYRKADIVNVRWGTRMPITYNDPVYGFPVNLRGFGNFSIRIVEPVEFFTRIVAGRDCFGQSELQELLLSRVMQPIGTYLATARFSYAEIASHMNEIADAAKNVTENVFAGLGFSLLDFRIESTSFDEETQKRIAEISDVQADAKAAQLVGVDFAELQRLKALRDAAKNPGAGGAAVGMMAGANLGAMFATPQPTPTQPAAAPTPPDARSRLKALKELFDDGLIDEADFQSRKQEILKLL